MQYAVAVLAVLASCLFLSPSAQAQVGRDHFAAWDRFEGRSGSTRAASRRVIRVARHSATRKATKQPRPIQARISPPVAAAPVAEVVRAVDAAVDTAVQATEQVLDTAVAVADTAIRTPLGVIIRTIATRAGVPGPVAAFLNEVQTKCGEVKVISTIRNGSRVGGRLSCHHYGQAVDYQVGNPSCAYAVSMNGSHRRLGHSNDYHGVRALYGAGMPVHFHVSNCGQEAGARFAHGGGKARTRYASRARYAKRYKTKRVRYARMWR